MSQTPTFPEMLRKMMNARLLEMHVSIPARVERYDASKLRIDAKPLIKRAFSNEEGQRTTEELPVIPNVPIVFPGAGVYRITFPIAKGDLVLLVISEASIDKWLETENVVDPIDDRRNQLIDAIAFPGLRSFKDAVAANEDALVVDADEVRLGSADATEHVMKGDAYRSAEDTMITSIKTFIDAVITNGTGTIKPPLITAATATSGAIAAFLAGASGYLATKVKVE